VNDGDGEDTLCTVAFVAKGTGAGLPTEAADEDVCFPGSGRLLTGSWFANFAPGNCVWTGPAGIKDGAKKDGC
jgi:hypothetical protein